MKYVNIGIIALVVLFVFYKSSESKKIAAKNLVIGQQFLQENQSKEGIQTTPSGLQFEIIAKGNGTQNPTASNTVTVHYHGTMLNGVVFDSSVERGAPLSFPLHRVIPGWTEGVQLMVVGDKFRFFIPPELAYGNNAAGKIEPGSTLIFEVELLGIE